jgi:D-3-phosphoglycerate dehydrogenase
MLSCQSRGKQILGIRSKTKLDQDFFEQVSKQKNKMWACGCFCIGTNQVDLVSAAQHGVSVFNAPFSNTRSVAEQTIAEIIMLNRGLTHRSNGMHNGIWNKSANGSHEIRGKTLGVVGYGRIGSQVSIMAEALGMRVLYYDTVKQLQLGNAVQVDSLELLLGSSDVVSLHVPSIPSTRNMINGQALSMMKHSAFLINNARGSVVDIDALAEAIENQTLGGCAIDVFPDEPASNSEPFASPLQHLPNCILTPHTAGSTQEAQENIGIEVALKLVNALDTGSTSTSVNMPEVELPSLPPAEHGVCRIVHMHMNQPGMLSQINSATAHCEANVVGQYLQSNPSHSYLAIDIEGAEDARRNQLVKELREIDGTIFARLIL